MERWTVAELDVTIDKVLAALAQVEAAKQNLLTAVRNLERMAKGALASTDRPGPERSG